jgi:ketosteroid isomerase-like protein
MDNSLAGEVLKLNQKLLESIANSDWATYEQLCDPELTAYEPEAQGQLIEGLEFHRFYFNLSGVKRQHHTTMCAPHVRVIGDVAIVACVRLNQRVNADGSPRESAVEETRIWQRKNGQWKHIHFHRSPLAKA